MGVAAMTLPRIAAAQPSFPEGAVVRTILKDCLMYRTRES
jgi:hypothetical protein